MSRFQRKILFWSALSLFLILSPIIVAYAMGYTLNTATLSLVKTSSIRLVANTAGSVSINSEYAGDTSYLGNSFSASRILPQNIALSFERDGYYSWTKAFSLSPGEFVDFPKVVIPPLELVSEQIATISFNPKAIYLDSGFLYLSESLPKTVQTQSKKPTSLKPKTARFDMRNAFLRALVSSESFDSNLASLSYTTDIVPFSGSLNKASLKEDLKFKEFGGDGRTAFFTDNQLFMTWARQTGYQPFIDALYTSKPINFASKINDVFWYKDGEHLFVLSSGTIFFIDIDFRGEIQKYPLVKNIKGPIIYIDYQNSLYIVDNKKLIRLGVDF